MFPSSPLQKISHYTTFAKFNFIVLIFAMLIVTMNIASANTPMPEGEHAATSADVTTTIVPVSPTAAVKSELLINYSSYHVETSSSMLWTMLDVPIHVEITQGSAEHVQSFDVRMPETDEDNNFEGVFVPDSNGFDVENTWSAEITIGEVEGFEILNHEECYYSDRSTENDAHLIIDSAEAAGVIKISGLAPGAQIGCNFVAKENGATTPWDYNTSSTSSSTTVPTSGNPSTTIPNSTLPTSSIPISTVPASTPPPASEPVVTSEAVPIPAVAVQGTSVISSAGGGLPLTGSSSLLIAIAAMLLIVGGYAITGGMKVRSKIKSKY